MKLLAVLVPCACLPLAAALLGSSEAGGGAAPARLSHRPVRPLPEVVEEPVQLVAPPSEPAVRAVSEREDLRRAAPTPPPREVVQVAEAPSGLDALPPSAREVVRLRAVLEERLADRLGPDHSCPASLVHCLHRAQLDPAELSDRDLFALHREHTELQDKLAQRLEGIELAVGDAVTPGGVAAWEEFEAEGDALVSMRLR